MIFCVISNKSVEQCGLTKNQSMLPVTQFEEWQTEVGVLQLFYKSDKFIRHTHSSRLLQQNGLDIGTIPHLRTNRAYDGITYPYRFSDPKDFSNTLENLVCATMCVSDSRKLVPEGGKVGARSQECRVCVNVVGPS